MSGQSENYPVPRLVGLVRALRDCCQQQEGEMCHRLALTASQFACLLAMPETSSLNIQEVSQAMGLSPSRASRVVDSLVRSGLMDRSSADHDRRQQVLALTPIGRSKWQAAHKLLLECEQKLLSHLSGPLSQELAEAFETVIKALVKGTQTKKVGKDAALAVHPQ
jgi:MarR family transcriptional regulator, organic hydroperoxide resistance regulator